MVVVLRCLILRTMKGAISYSRTILSLIGFGNRNTYDTRPSKEDLQGFKNQDPNECSGLFTTKIILFVLLLGL